MHNLFLLLFIILPFLTFGQRTSTTYSSDSIQIIVSYPDGTSKIINEAHKIPIAVPRFKDAPENERAISEDDIVKQENLNYWLLDSMVWIECNRYRISQHILPADWCDILYPASKHHSEYQAHFATIIHGEDDTIPGKLEDKEYYDVIFNKSAEICLLNYIKFGEDTYREVALKIINQWKNSPSHNSVMVGSKYKVSSFGCALSPGFRSILNRNNFNKYNPQLLKKIEALKPDFFRDFNNSSYIAFYSTGHFMKDCSTSDQNSYNSGGYSFNLDDNPSIEGQENKQGIMHRFKRFISQ